MGEHYEYLEAEMRAEEFFNRQIESRDRTIAELGAANARLIAAAEAVLDHLPAEISDEVTSATADLADRLSWRSGVLLGQFMKQQAELAEAEDLNARLEHENQGLSDECEAKHRLVKALYAWRADEYSVAAEHALKDALDAYVAGKGGAEASDNGASQPGPNGFGRRNVHCSNCGDERGGPFGHEISECKYRHGMTAAEVAEILPDDRQAAFWDQCIDRYMDGEDAADDHWRPAKPGETPGQMLPEAGAASGLGPACVCDCEDRDNCPYTVTCPTCQRPAGTSCINLQGREIMPAHGARGGRLVEARTWDRGRLEREFAEMTAYAQTLAARHVEAIGILDDALVGRSEPDPLLRLLRPLYAALEPDSRNGRAADSRAGQAGQEADRG